ncbi:MAG: sugar ABC transporter permease [Spirochaetales bacterium]|nr:sugar ABC transporter permease [Spirochaetales bacterium]
MNQSITITDVKLKHLDLAKHEARWGLIFISPWIVGFLLFYLFPMIASIGFTMMNINLGNTEETRFIGIENWKRALTGGDTKILESIINISRFALLSLPIGMGFGLFLAILMNSKLMIGKELFRTLFYMPTMIPLAATTLIWTGVFNEYTGWINLFLQNVFGVKAMGVNGVRWLADPNLIYYTYTIMGLWGVGNMMLLLLAGLQKVPTELYEAARVDGAGWWRQLWHITIPMISPIIFYNLTLGVIGIMQYFLVPYILNGGSGYPEGMTYFIMVHFYKQAFTYFNMGYGAVIAWIIFLIALALTGLLFGTANKWVYYAGGTDK